MKDPSQYPKTLYMLQIADTVLYLIVGIVVYRYVGDNAVSPALGNASKTLSKVAYGVAIPTIIIAGVINGHVAAKFIFVGLFRSRADGTPSKHLASHTVKGWVSWILICVAVWIIAFIIAEVIPFFNDLLSVIASLFASWFTYGISGIFWLFLTRKRGWFRPLSPRYKPRYRWQALFSFALIAAAIFIMVGGMYAAIVSIIKGYTSGGFPGPFTCASRGSS